VLVELEGALRVMPNKDGGRILLDTRKVAGMVRPGAADGVLVAFHFHTHPVLPLPCSTAPPYPPPAPERPEVAAAQQSARNLEPTRGACGSARRGARDGSAKRSRPRTRVARSPWLAA
jgi:hypothetical protein